MGSPFIQVGATLMCPHGGSVSIVSSNTKVMATGALSTVSDTFTIAGCPFQIPVGPAMKPQPCIKVQWVVTALRVTVNKQPAVLQSSTGLCLSAEQIPQGPPTVVLTQLRASGT